MVGENTLVFFTEYLKIFFEVWLIRPAGEHIALAQKSSWYGTLSSSYPVTFSKAANESKWSPDLTWPANDSFYIQIHSVQVVRVFKLA